MIKLHLELGTRNSKIVEVNILDNVNEKKKKRAKKLLTARNK
jgi:hypothetical protein